MKKIVLLALGLLILSSNTSFAADDAAAPAPETTAPTAQEQAQAAPAVESAPVEVPAPAAAQDAAPAPEAVAASTEAPAPAVTGPQEQPSAAPLAENLEFISGEITGIDEAAKSVTVKLYGETENAANDKILTVSIDESTDITDGEKDRDLKSLTVGTEVDVEYDPKTNKATYIFVY